MNIAVDKLYKSTSNAISQLFCIIDFVSSLFLYNDNNINSTVTVNSQQNPPTTKITMKLTLVFAALLAVAIAAPSIAAPASEDLEKRSDGCAKCNNHKKLCWSCNSGGCSYNTISC